MIYVFNRRKFLRQLEQTCINLAQGAILVRSFLEYCQNVAELAIIDHNGIINARKIGKY